MSSPPGWYNDPSGSGQLRYWDGSIWTEHYAPAAPVSPVSPGSAPRYPGPVGPPPRQGMSGCLKAFLIVLGIMAVGGTALLIALVAVGGRVVNHLNTSINGTAGRPASLPADVAGYPSERKQDQVANSAGTVTLGSITVTATDWARTTATAGGSLVCGNVVVHRTTATSKNPFDAALQLAGNFNWTLVTSTGSTTSYDPTSSSLSALNDYLTTNRTGDFSGRACFQDPGSPGQYAVIWQPRLLRAERAVWILNLH